MMVRRLPRSASARDGNAEQGVEQREREAVQDAHLRVANAKIAADGPDEQSEDLPIDERRGVGEREDPHDVPRVFPSWKAVGHVGTYDLSALGHAHERGVTLPPVPFSIVRCAVASVRALRQPTERHATRVA